jgi:hypothetical protein
VVYLIMPSVAQTIQHPMVGWLINEMQSVKNKAVMTYFKCDRPLPKFDLFLVQRCSSITVGLQAGQWPWQPCCQRIDRILPTCSDYILTSDV